MKETLLEKTETIAKIPENCDAAIFIGFIPRRKTQSGETLGLTESLVEAARNSMAATLESVGTPSTLTAIARLSTDALGDDETTRISVIVSHEKISPDPLPEIEPEPLELDGENDATSTDETPLDENAVAIDAPETSEA